MSAKKENVLTISAVMDVPHPAETIWPLLCPVKEYDWIEIWDCEVVHTVSGVNELGCVFRTSFPREGSVETWVTTRFDPHSRIEFARINDDKVIRFEIELTPTAQGTRVVWTHHVTPLNDNGRRYLRLKPEMFSMQMSTLYAMLVHYLDTGTMLRGVNPETVERIETYVHGGKTG